MLTAFPVAVRVGKGYVEACPNGINKGSMAERAVDIAMGGGGGANSPGVAAPLDYVLCIGDDSSDELMFQVRHLTAISMPLRCPWPSPTFHGLPPHSIAFSHRPMPSLTVQRLPSLALTCPHLLSPSLTFHGVRMLPRSPPQALHSKFGMHPADLSLFTVTVGRKPSKAQAYLGDHTEVPTRPPLHRPLLRGMPSPPSLPRGVPSPPSLPRGMPSPPVATLRMPSSPHHTSLGDTWHALLTTPYLPRRHVACPPHHTPRGDTWQVVELLKMLSSIGNAKSKRIFSMGDLVKLDAAESPQVRHLPKSPPHLPPATPPPSSFHDLH